MSSGLYLEWQSVAAASCAKTHDPWAAQSRDRCTFEASSVIEAVRSALHEDARDDQSTLADRDEVDDPQVDDELRDLPSEVKDLVAEFDAGKGPDAEPFKVAAGLQDRDRLGEFLERLGLEGSAAEIGVEYGDFAQQTLRDWKSCRRWWILDSFEPVSGTDSMLAQDQAAHTDRLDFVHGALQPWFQTDVARVVSKELQRSLSAMPGESLSFVYIEGPRKDEESLWSVFQQVWPKLQPGAMLAGHDYTRAHASVARAVNKWAASQGLQLFLTDVQKSRPDVRGNEIPPCCPSWYLFKPTTTRSIEEDAAFISDSMNTEEPHSRLL